MASGIEDVLTVDKINQMLDQATATLMSDQVDLSMDGSAMLEQDFPNFFNQQRENEKVQQELAAQIEREQREQVAKAYVFRQQQVGSPGNISAPARIKNRI